MPDPRSRRLALATGLTYHVLEWGDPAAPAVFLIHGFLDLAWGWDRVARRLADRFHLIAPDLRGHGDTDWIGAGGYYHFFDYIADVDDLVARLGGPQVAMVGHSMGGSVAAYWAGARPTRIRRLALLEGQGPPDQAGDVDGLPERATRWFEAWKRARTRPLRIMADVDEAAARLRQHDPLLDEVQARELAAHGTRPVRDGVTWKHDPLHLTMGPYPFRVDLAAAFWRRIACPTLVVDGEASMLRLPDADREARRGFLGDARHAVLPGAGHMMQRHQPDALAELLAAHLGA
ncbi:MAG: alpha/beta hydrolase [Kofleriaceae bacterium]|nr:alpha/beta hydrolase [Kofleriaceae bacterium]